MKPSSHTQVLRLIGVFKLLKTATLIATGIGAFKLFHRDVGTVLERWTAMINLDPGSTLVNHTIQRITLLSPQRIRDLGIVSFIYAGLFLTEGIGLLLLKRWAEWFTVIITASLVPIEIYELIHRPNALKSLVLLVNIAVVVYLIHHIRHHPPAENGD
jgi:uncharacterized membrane protein (DUF2068 family)